MGSSNSVAVPAPVQKTHRALLPLFISLVVVCYLDRTSLAFAALQLCNTDWFNAKVYGLGSGVFYAGYVLFQIPSNLMLSRIGAKIWLPFITAAFGAVAVCSALLIKGPASFYALRLALGITEAGVFPGMWHVCGQFYPNLYITVPYSVIEASIAVSQILAAPAAAALLQLSGVLGLEGWQWLFMAEGLATLLVAVVLRCRLPSSVGTAPFLSREDRVWLSQQLGMHGSAAEHAGSQLHKGVSAQHEAADDAVLLVDNVNFHGDLNTEHVNVDSSDSTCAASKLQRIELQSHSSSHRASSKDASSSCGVPDHRHNHQVHPCDKRQQCVHHSSADTLSGGSSSSLDVDVQGQHHDGGNHSNGPPMTSWQQVYSTFTNGLILYLMLLKALKDIALDGLVYWVPMLVHALIDGNSLSLSVHNTTGASSSKGQKHCGGKDSQLHAVLLSSIPFGTAAIATVLLGHSSEKRQERRMHIGLPLLTGGCAFMLLPLLLQLATHIPAFIAVTAAVVAADATTGPFWSWVHGAAAPGTGAVSLAAVNSIGKAGGFLGPLSFGLILHATGSYVPSILLVGAVLLCGGAMALLYAGERLRRYQKLPDVHIDKHQSAQSQSQ